jgi:class 3 adenylate cyclase
MSRIQRTRLQRQQDQLQSAGVSHQITSVLNDLITNSASQHLARIRPIAVARRFGLPEQDVIDACLQAVRSGLLTMAWDLICPSCRMAADAKQTLSEIEQHASCSACQTDFNLEFGSSIELVFRVHPDIRTADSKLYCNGGPGNFPHVVAQVSLEPGERLVLNLNLGAGSYTVRGPRLPFTIPLEVDARHGSRLGSARFTEGMSRPYVAPLLAGHQQLTIENAFADRHVVRIERNVRRSDAITAAEATALPLFRKLFPQQTLAPGQLVQLATTNFVAIQADDMEAMFAELGDSGVYLLMVEYRQFMQRYIRARGGSVIDEQGGLILATFPDLGVATEAACGLYTELTPALPARRWSLSGALHRGSALVTSDRHEINYFGATVNETVHLARRAPSGQLVLTCDAWSDPGVQDVLALLGPDSEVRVSTANSLQQIPMNMRRASLTVSPHHTKG